MAEVWDGSDYIKMFIRLSPGLPLPSSLTLALSLRQSHFKSPRDREDVRGVDHCIALISKNVSRA